MNVPLSSTLFFTCLLCFSVALGFKGGWKKNSVDDDQPDIRVLVNAWQLILWGCLTRGRGASFLQWSLPQGCRPRIPRYHLFPPISWPRYLSRISCICSVMSPQIKPAISRPRRSPQGGCLFWDSIHQIANTFPQGASWLFQHRGEWLCCTKFRLFFQARLQPKFRLFMKCRRFPAFQVSHSVECRGKIDGPKYFGFLIFLLARWIPKNSLQSEHRNPTKERMW